MSNEDVVANALKLDDTPNVGTPELDPETAQLLKLFDDEVDGEVPEVEAVVEEVAPVEEAKAPEPEKEDGQDEAEPEVAPPEAESTEAEPDSEPSSATEPEAPAETPALDIPEAKQEPPPELSPEDRQKWRDDALVKLQQHYAKQIDSDEMRDQLLTEPEKALPQILASAYLDMYDSLMGGVTQTMPNQVRTLMDQAKQAQQYESDFFTKWPQLQKAYGAGADQQGVIQRAIVSYRQMNPDVPVDKAIEEAGAMAMVALRIPIEGGEESGKENTSSPPPADEKGFAPASPGGGAQHSAPPPAPKKLNEFEQLAQELIDDEEV